MAIGGGSPVNVCDLPAGIVFPNGTWNHDGIILFGGPSVLYTVSAAGGLPAKAPAAPGAARMNPAFLPDGRHYFFSVFEGTRSALWVGSLDSPAARRILEGVAAARFATGPKGGPEGYLLYVVEGTLLGRRFHSETLALSGDPFLLGEPIASVGSRASFGVSGTALLAFQIGLRNTTDVVLLDRTGKMETPFEPGTYAEVVVSPDGRRAALGEGNTDNLDGRELWLLDLRTKVHTRFTFNPGTDSHPVWSPDGGRIAFGSQRDGAIDLYVKGSSGAGAEELLLKNPNRKLPTDWSRDGKYLIYSEGGSIHAESDIWILPITGDRKPRVYLKTEHSEAHGKVSPDGNYLAYQSNESGTVQIYIRPFPDASRGKWQVSTSGGAQPVWGRDGRQLYYVGSENGRILAATVKLGPAGSPAAEVATPVDLMDSHMYGSWTGTSAKYGVLPDGRFLVAAQSERESTPLTVVLNWR